MLNKKNIVNTLNEIMTFWAKSNILLVVPYARLFRRIEAYEQFTGNAVNLVM